MSRRISKGISFLRFLAFKGIASWIVGGSVRDFLLGYEPRDMDIVADSTPDIMYRIFPEMKPKGRKGGISYHVLWKGSSFELVLLEGKTLKADLARRDFTINSMAMDSGGKIIDIYGGRRDLAASVVRFTVDPESRIAEDPSRLLRFCRFSSFLNFRHHSLSSAIVRKKSFLLGQVASERSGAEILKVLEDEHFSFSGFLYCLKKHELLLFLMPFLIDSDEAAVTLSSVRYLESVKATSFELAAALLFNADSVSVMQEWSWPKKYKRYVTTLIKWVRALSGASLKEDVLVDGAGELGIPGLNSVKLLLLSRNLLYGISERMQWNLKRMYSFAEYIKLSVKLPNGEEIIERLGINEGAIIKEIKFEFLREAAKGNIKNLDDIERVFDRVKKGG